MSTDRIQDGINPSDRTGKIRPGDLVVVNEHFIDETYFETLKNFTGLVTGIASDIEVPALMEVFWSDGVFETMYEDELDKLTGDEVGIN